MSHLLFSFAWCWSLYVVCYPTYVGEDKTHTKKKDSWNNWRDKINVHGNGNNKLIQSQPRHCLTGQVFCGFTQFLRPHARIVPQLPHGQNLDRNHKNKKI
jgi:hypothetical protein